MPFTWNPEAPVAAVRVGYVKSEFEEIPAQAMRFVLSAESAAAFDALRARGAWTR